MRIRALLHAHGFIVQDWDKVRTATLTISRTSLAADYAVVSAHA